MSHRYGNGAKIANGDGALDSAREFPVTMSSGLSNLKRSGVCEIRQGQAPAEKKYHRMVIQENEGMASFRQAQSDFADACQENTPHLRECQGSVEKQVVVKIRQKDFKTLKTGHYRLCFAKKIAEYEYNVVWKSFSNYLLNNVFSWTPQYRLFGSNQFRDGKAVNVSTNVVTISLGQTAILSPIGILQKAVSGGSPAGFTMRNKYGSIHVGVSQACTRLDGTPGCSPMYVSTAAALKGDIALTPVDKVLIWFQQDVVSGTMFSAARTDSLLSGAKTDALELDLTKNSSVTCLFSEQAWRIVG